MKKTNSIGAKSAAASAASTSQAATAAAANGSKPGNGVKEVNLEHMPQFIKNAPWYMNK